MFPLWSGQMFSERNLCYRINRLASLNETLDASERWQSCLEAAISFQATAYLNCFRRTWVRYFEGLAVGPPSTHCGQTGSWSRPSQASLRSLGHPTPPRCSLGGTHYLGDSFSQNSLPAGYLLTKVPRFHLIVYKNFVRYFSLRNHLLWKRWILELEGGWPVHLRL